MNPIEALQQEIGHSFVNQQLFSQALVHRSALQGTPHEFDNERLEFLGDRVLNLCIADMVFKNYRGDSEGRLSKRHAALVRQDTLAVVARKIGLGPCLTLGKGEESTGGRDKDSILSDAIEALIAALYLDAPQEEDISIARAFVKKYWTPMLDQVELKDPKSRLQEWLQSNGHPLPVYEVMELRGDAHQRTFVMEVITRNFGRAVGEGSSKQSAQQEAARALLEQLPNKGRSDAS